MDRETAKTTAMQIEGRWRHMARTVDEERMGMGLTEREISSDMEK